MSLHAIDRPDPPTSGPRRADAARSDPRRPEPRPTEGPAAGASRDDRPPAAPHAAARPPTASAPAGAEESADGRSARHRARALVLERTVAALHGAAANDVAWLEDCLDAVAESDPARTPRTFDLAFGLAPRRLGRDPLGADQSARERLRREGEACLPGWHPGGWRLDEAARVLLITAAGDAAVPALLARTLRHADLPEQLALYRALPLFPTCADVIATVRRGLRTNMRAVFEAIAHDNPWPARHLDEAGWNQMVLKALFVESALDPIQGLDARANAELATMLVDYARERRAAGRAVPTELARALGPYATPDALALLVDPTA